MFHYLFMGSVRIWQWIEHTWENLATGETMHGGSGSGSDIYRERDPATREDETRPDAAERRQPRRESRRQEKRGWRKKDCAGRWILQYVNIFLIDSFL
ncbi:hypothetical protein TNCT_44031 [Trichonephila clavata]|uniref:Uncharacterized protein n=1 Tax=Trichonephila clavata TaxID=2740835 RepID=A0A8X6HHJ4_TRICU|nr:hypothetical protein TNCT_44031 [Trichonephila clavata]